MTQEQRVALFFVLAMAILMAFSWLNPPQRPKPPQDIQAAATQVQNSQAPAPTQAPTDIPQPAISPENPVPAADPQSDLPERTIYLTTPLYRAVFSSKGASLVSYQLDQYKLQLKHEERVEMLELPVEPGLPGTLEVVTSDAISGLQAGNWAVESGQERIVIEGGERQTPLVFSTITADGLLVQKALRVNPANYDLQVILTLTNQSSQKRQIRPGLGFGTNFGFLPDHQQKHAYTHYGPLLLAEGKRKAESWPDGTSPTAPVTGVQWGGIENGYYFFGTMLPEPFNQTLTAQIQGGKEHHALSFLSEYLTLDPGTPKSLSYRVYLGPKDFDKLDSVNPLLTRSIDYGIFTLVAVPLFHGLRSIFEWVGNYGVAIILLTIMVRGVLLIFTYKQVKSGLKMASLQPKIEELKRKHKDKQELNQKIFELYRQEGINPLGSCLPLLLQLPVFIALYNVLAVSIELRHAPFLLWVHDLSAPDPYYVLPILMGITALVLQWYTPMPSMDPAQAKVMMVMPLFFAFISLNFPAGLTLYWFISNLVGVIQQFVITRPLYAAAGKLPAKGKNSRRKNG